jgi:hypothetical protein
MEQLNAEYQKCTESHVNYILTGDVSRLKAYSTETRYQQFTDGKITLEQAQEYAIIRKIKELEKQRTKKAEHLERIANAETITAIEIYIVWKRSATWGYNPHAEITVYTKNGHKTTFDTASGCGYDKRSAAVAGALNQNDAVLKLLCDYKENSINNGVTTSRPGNTDYIAYGAGYEAIPYFEGGVGYSCFDYMFINLFGFKRTSTHETKTTDYYYYEKA